MTTMTLLHLQQSVMMIISISLILAETVASFAVPMTNNIFGSMSSAAQANVYEMAQLAALASHCNPGAALTEMIGSQCKCINDLSGCLQSLACQSGVMYPQLLSNNCRLLYTFSTHSTLANRQKQQQQQQERESHGINGGLKAGGKGFIMDLSSGNDRNVELGISFAGSTVLEDWLHDFRAWLVPFPSIIKEPSNRLLRYQGNVEDDIADDDGIPVKRIHRGFYDMYNSFRAEMLEKLDSIISTYTSSESISLSLSGQSMGGALSLLLMHDILECVTLGHQCPFKNISSINNDGKSFISAVHVFTYGQPRVGDSAFTESLENLVSAVQEANRYRLRIDVDYVRVMNSMDIVPALPPTFLGYRHFNMNGRYYAFNPSELIQMPSHNRTLCQSPIDSTMDNLPKLIECSIEAAVPDIDGNLVDPQNPLCLYRLSVGDGGVNNGHPLYFWNLDNVKRECKLMACS